MTTAAGRGGRGGRPAAARWRRARAAAVVLVLLLSVSGAGYGDAVPPPKETLRAPRPQLGPRYASPGACLEWARAGTGGGVPGSGTHRIAVYGDGDPMAGRMLAALYAGDDPYQSAPVQGRSVAVRGKSMDTTSIGAAGDLRLIHWWGEQGLWDVEPPQFAVVGRGLSEGELGTAAEYLVEDRSHVRLRLAGVPWDLRPMVSAPVKVGEHWAPSLPGGTTLTWSDPRNGGTLSLTSARAGRRAAALVTALVSGRRRTVRGVPGFAGTAFPAATPEATPMVRVWWEHGTIALVSATGLSEAELDQAVEELRPMGPVALRSLRRSGPANPCVRRSAPP